MEDAKEKLTKEQLIEKINNERITFTNILQQQDKRHADEIAHVQMVSNMVLARVITAFGHQEGDEWVLEIRKPEGLWAVGAEKKDDTYILRTKQIEI